MHIYTLKPSKAEFFTDSYTIQKKVEAKLFDAAKTGNIQVLKELIHEKISFNIQDEFLRTPLELAASSGHIEVVQVLIEVGSKINTQNSNGESPLHLAIIANNEEVVRLLLEAGANAAMQNNEGSTPLHFAAYEGHTSIVEILLQNKAHLDTPTQNGHTPLLMSIFKGHKDIFHLLLQAGSNVNLQDNFGQSSLHYVASFGRKEEAELLIKAGANIDLMDNDGQSSLYLAASKGYEEIVELLIHNQAELNAQNTNGQTPYIAAIYSNHRTVAQVIFNALSLSSQQMQKEILRMASVGHSAHLDGVGLLQPRNKKIAPQKIALERSNYPYWLRKMYSAVQDFSRLHPELMTSGECEQLLCLFESENSSSVATLLKLQQGLPILFSTGFIGHKVAVLIWNSILILCNRGESSRKPIEAYTFDRESLNEDMLNKIYMCRFKGKYEYEHLFFEELPERLNFKQKHFESRLESICPLDYQKAENCAWASLETAVWAYLALKELKGNKFGMLDTLKMPSEDQFLKCELSQKFTAWLAFNQLYHFERYLGVRYLRGNYSHDKIVKSSLAREMYVLDSSLVNSARKAILNTIRALNAQNEYLIQSDFQRIEEIFSALKRKL